MVNEELFEEQPRVADADRLTLDLDGWEGPLDLLLTLARTQKVDLAKISILALVEQYLAFIADAKTLKLEIAADYLVMAAWLAYLKSCLLLPKDEQVDPSPEELAMRLQLRLQRLNAMREAGARLMARDRIGRDVFVRGAPEGLRVVRKAALARRSLRPHRRLWQRPRAQRAGRPHRRRRPVMTLDEALAAGRAAARRAASTGRRSKPSCPRRRTPNSASRRSPRASSRRSSWPGRARSSSRRRARSRPFMIRAA